MYRSDSVGKIILKVLLIVFLFACFFGVIIFWPNISNFINSFFEVEEVEQIKTNYYHVFEMNDMIYGMRDDGSRVVKNYTTPGTGPYWDKRMVSAEMQDVVKEVQEYVGGRR